MVVKDAKVRVRMDTKAAKADLRSLVKEGTQTAGRVTQRVRGAVSRGLSTVGLGAGIATGMQAVRGATASGFGDVLSETLGGLGLEIEEALLGDLGPEARANKAAREEVIQNFASVAGATGAIPPQAHAFFEQTRALRHDEETGKRMLNKEFHMDYKDVLDRVLENVRKLLVEAVELLASKLNPF